MAGIISVKIRKRKDKLPAAVKALPIAAVVKVQRHGERIADRARGIVPVDTGALQNTIRYEGAGPTNGRVIAGGDGVEYATFVHEGTIRMSARPFLAQAAADQRAEFLADFEQIGRELA